MTYYKAIPLVLIFLFTCVGSVLADGCNNLYKAEKYKEAFPVCAKAAKQGEAIAQFNLGYMYDSGNGVGKNAEKAEKWYRKAAAQGIAKAQYNLGQMYYSGDGVAQNYGEAAKWMRKSAEQGFIDAQVNLGQMYYSGDGVAQNYGEAAKWTRKAADQGNAVAQYNLGVMLEKGQGVSQNNDEAMVWFNKAAKQGDKSSIDRVRKEVQSTKSAIHRLAGNSKLITVRAQGYGLIPGAIICKDFDTTNYMARLYADSRAAIINYSMLPKQTSKQVSLLQGRPSPLPEFKEYGCALIPSGKSMMMEEGNVVPVVIVKLPNGKIIKGITEPSMVKPQ